MARPSVLFMNRIYPPYRGATGRVLQELARSFVKKKWDVSIVTSGPKASRYKDGPIEIITVKGPQKPGAMISYIWVWLKMLGVALCLRRRDLLVTMTDPPLLVVVGALIVRIKRMRHIHWCQDLFPDILPAIDVKMPGFLMRFYKRAAYRAMNKCEKVIVIGRCMARHMAYNGIDPRHITVIPNWPNFELVRVKSKKSYNELKRDHEEQNEGKAAENLFKSPVKFRVLYAGNLGKAHPVDTIIEAAALLQKEHPEIEFVFVGDGPRFDHIARERARRELDNIRLIPYQPPAYLKKIMESGDLHLISMKEEAAGFLVSSKLYSALAVQRPCIFIGPEQSETAKVIRDFAAGTTVHQEDAEGLAHAIKTYRMDSDAWFAAHHGAAEAGKVFVPNEAIKAWIKRADAVVTAAGAAGDIKSKEKRMKETVQEPSLGDLFKEIWSLRRFILAGALSGIFLAGLWSYSATPYYRAWMILSPANPMNGAEISSLLADDNLFALRYLVQRVSVANSSDFMRFENIYDGPSVAKILLEQEDVLRGLAQDHAFRFTAPRRQSWSPEKLAEYLHDTVRLEPVNGSTLRRLSYKHPNPDFAKYFISGMHMVSDALIRRTIKEEAKARAAYLKAAVAETENPEHKRSLTTLLLEQERLLMLASLDQPYAAAIVEPAAVSFKPVWPDPALLFAGLTALGALAGFLAGSFRMPAVGGVFQKQQPGRRPVNAKKWFSGEKANSNHTEETPEEKPPSSARTVK